MMSNSAEDQMNNACKQTEDFAGVISYNSINKQVDDDFNLDNKASQEQVSI